MSNRTFVDETSASAIWRVVLSGYALGDDVLVRRQVAARLRPHLGGLRRGEELHERLRGRVVVEHHRDVTTGDDRRLTALDRREREHLRVRPDLRVGVAADRGSDEVALDHHGGFAVGR